MEPLEGEQMVLEADNKTLLITTHRVRYSGRIAGSDRIVSIMLDKVSSCELTHTSYRTLLFLAVLAVVVGLVLNNERDGSPVVVGVVVAFFFVIAYLATRKQVLRIASPSSHIDVLLAGMSLEKAIEVIDSIEREKNTRYWLRIAAVSAEHSTR